MQASQVIDQKSTVLNITIICLAIQIYANKTEIQGTEQIKQSGLSISIQ